MIIPKEILGDLSQNVRIKTNVIFHKHCHLSHQCNQVLKIIYRSKIAFI